MAGFEVGRSEFLAVLPWRRTSWIAGAVAALVLVVPPGAEAAAALTMTVGKLAGSPQPVAPTERPDAVSAMVSARESGQRVEDLSQRSESSSTFANPDGTWSVESFTGPVRVEMADGVWRDLDERLVRSGDVVRPRVAGTPLLLPDGAQARGGVSRLATLRGEDSAGRPVTLGLDWMGSLPKPELDGTKARYTGAGTARSNQARADVTVEALRGGFSHSVLLHEPPASAPTYRFPLSLSDGLSLQVAEDTGALFVVDEAGETVFYAPTPLMWDARIDEVSGEPAHVVPLTVEVETGKAGPVLVITPDADFLADAQTVYPVTIDPAWTGVISTDTWIQYNDYLSSQTSSPELKAGTYNGSQKARSFLKFGLSGLSGKKIESATLRLYNYYSGSCTGATIYAARILDDWSPSTLTWSNQPTAAASDQASLSAAKGYNSSCPGGYAEWAVTAIVQKWADGTPNYGFRLRAADETSIYTWRRYRSANYQSGDHSHEPHLLVTYNSYPSTPGTPSITGMTGSSSDAYYLTTDTSPEVKATVSDPDGGSVRGRFEVLQGTTSKWSSYSSYVTSGSTAKKTIPEGTLAQNTTYTLRVWGNDGSLTSKSYKEIKFRIDATAPSTPAVTCTNVANGQWYDTLPASSTTCTFTSSSDTKTFEWKHNGTSRTALTASSGSGTTPSITIPASGVTTIEARAKDTAGNLSGWRTFRFGTGLPGLLQPAPEERSTSTFPVEASGPPSAMGATVQWRLAGDTAGAWTDAAAGSVRVASTGSTWTGTVSDSGGASVTGRLTWDAAATGGPDAPSVVELRVCFTYSGGLTKCSAPPSPSDPTSLGRVHRVPHAFGSSFPVQDAGPGQVALFTGEFQYAETDVQVPAYADTLTLGRSHRSLDGPPTGPAGVFGPGWVADLTGPEAGMAGFEVIDRTGVDGSITLLSPEGDSYVYWHSSGTRGAQQTGTYVGEGETETWEDVLELTAVGTGGATHNLTLTEGDGTTTAWERTTAGTWVITRVEEPQQTGTTTYARDGSGKVTWIFAPAPAGITCTATTQLPGCRALNLVYTTINGQARLARVDLVIYDPKPGADGKPTAAAGMTATTIAKYAYDTSGQLVETWDPRVGDGTAALKTTYTYATVAGKTVLATVTPPGQQAWRFAHDTQGRLTTVKRQHDPAVGTGDATWTIAYELSLSGAGLPDLRPAATAAWGQPEADAPTGAAAVFEPDRVPAAPPTSGDWPYASIFYYSDAGRTSNTAAYGAGAWQITTSRYDQHGNQIWSLDAGNRAAALAAGGDTAAAAERLAEITVYDAEGTRVEKTLGPSRDVVVLTDGATVAGRTHTAYVYDDEAAAEGVPIPGRPTEIPEVGFDLLVEERHSVTDAANPGEAGAAEWDTRRVRYRYDKVSSSDGDGWTLRIPTRISMELGDGTWATMLTRFDTEGKMIETRTPEGVQAVDGAGSDLRSTVTVHYTADGSAADPECRHKPEWVGMVCRVGPAGQPSSGQPLPVTFVKGYDALLSPARAEERTGTPTQRVTVTAHDAAGRRISEATTVSSAPAGDQPVPAVSYGYDPATGLPTTTSAGGQTMSTIYDSWGRVVSQTDGVGTTAATSYDTAGRVKTLSDGKGMYTYSYDGTDALGRVERRGLPTALDVGLPSGEPDLFTAAYGPDGAIEQLGYPNGIAATWARDAAGTSIGLTYARGGMELLGFAAAPDRDGRIRIAGGPVSEQTFHYDYRGRLIRVQDSYAGDCTTRIYTFSGDSNRQSLTTHAPGAEGECTTATTPTVSTSSFDDADRIIDPGYSYDVLGRIRTVPAGHTDQPGAGPLTVGYHADDMVATLAQTVPNGESGSIAKTKAFTLDPARRLSTVTDRENGAETRRIVNHYSDTTDSPAWIATSSDAGTSWNWERYVRTPAGDLGAIQADDDTVTIQLANLHGDIVATVPNTTTDGITAYGEHSEYGQPRDPAASLTASRYGWLGAKQRSSDALAGLVLMGVRLYNPTSGRFLSVDPIPGGNDNPYTYPVDPVNEVDLDGRVSISLGWTRWTLKFGKWETKTFKYWLEVQRWVASGLVVGWIAAWGAKRGGYVAAGVAAAASLFAYNLVTTYYNWLLKTVRRAVREGKCLRIKSTYAMRVKEMWFSRC